MNLQIKCEKWLKMQTQPSRAALCTAWEDWLWYFLLYNSFQLETVAALVVGSGPEVRKEATIKNRMKKFKSVMAFVFYEWKCRTFWLQQATHTMQGCSSCQALLDMHPDFDRRKTLEELTVLWFVMLKTSLIDSLSRLRQNDLFVFWKMRLSELTINFFVVVAVNHQMYWKI